MPVLYQSDRPPHYPWPRRGQLHEGQEPVLGTPLALKIGRHWRLVTLVQERTSGNVRLFIFQRLGRIRRRRETALPVG